MLFLILPRMLPCTIHHENACDYHIDYRLDSLEDVYVPPFILTLFQDSYLNAIQDRYIPIFDPEYDTFDSVRSRSSILLNAICTIGCMVETSKSRPQTVYRLSKSIGPVLNQPQQGPAAQCLTCCTPS